MFVVDMPLCGLVITVGIGLVCLNGSPYTHRYGHTNDLYGWMDSAGSYAHGNVALCPLTVWMDSSGSCARDNVALCPVRAWEFVRQVSNYHLVNASPQLSAVNSPTTVVHTIPVNLPRLSSSKSCVKIVPHLQKTHRFSVTKTSHWLLSTVVRNM